MEIVTIDFETYYDQEYSLKNMTTQEYILDSRFEIIGVGIKHGDKPAMWVPNNGNAPPFLHVIDWANTELVCHNTLFDGAILAWHYGLIPKRYFCTMMGSRPNVIPFTHNGSMSLDNLGKHFNLDRHKGHQVSLFKGYKLSDFSADQLKEYGEYCKNDVEMTKDIYDRIIDDVPIHERHILDLTIRKFTQPQLDLDRDLITFAQAQAYFQKEAALKDAGLSDRDVLMSNNKFADALKNLGVDPPTKFSKTTGMQAWAFAKSDPGMIALTTHDNPQVRLLVDARLKHKSTIEQTRLDRFAAVAATGKGLAVPLLYYGAHTGRFSGWDKLNLQNLSKGSVLREAIIPIATDQKLVVGDLSQIEARITAALAGQQDLLEAFANGEDVYTLFAATRLFHCPEDQITNEQRFIGKMCILGLGFGMGANRFMDAVRSAGVAMSAMDAERAVYAYRSAYQNIVALWRKAETALMVLANGGEMQLGPCKITSEEILLPNGMKLYYPDMQRDASGGYWYTYQGRKKNIFGGALIENIVQALARIVFTTAELRLASKGFRAALTVHDELVYVVEEHKAALFAMAVKASLITPVSWLPELPLAAKVEIGDNYAEAK